MSLKKIEGRVWKYGDDVDTDVIIPARYLNTSSPGELAAHCLEDLDKNFSTEVNEGDIIAAGSNFGCGSSREHAPLAIKHSGISCVIAASFARIFFRNALNIGLPIFECPSAAAAIDDGDMVRIYPRQGEIYNLTQDNRYEISSYPPFIEKLIEKGGLINYTKGKVSE